MTVLDQARRVLVVDDDQDILEAIQLTLSSDGYETEITTRGDEALDLIQQRHPDVIILDVLLAGHDGRTICRLLKQNDQTRHIPIIMMSAHPSAKYSAATSGADSFVAKPFSIYELLAEVKRHLASSTSH